MDEGSILCLPNRTPLGRVEEVFGPVTEPLYSLRFAGGTEVPMEVRQGAAVCSVERFNTYVLPEAVQQAGWPPCLMQSLQAWINMHVCCGTGWHALSGGQLWPVICACGLRGQGSKQSQP